jgi:hypothetical protein
MEASVRLLHNRGMKIASFMEGGHVGIKINDQVWPNF